MRNLQEPRARRGWTVVEALIVVVLTCILLGTVVWEMGTTHRQGQKLSAQMSLHQTSRRALVRFLKEIQEGMEIVSPAPGSTLGYAVVRDKVSVVRWFYQRKRAGTERYELCRYIADPKIPEARRTEILLTGISRLTFTSQSEGSLQLNLAMVEDRQEYAMLTTVRLRNLAAAEALW